MQPASRLARGAALSALCRSSPSWSGHSQASSSSPLCSSKVRWSAQTTNTSACPAALWVSSRTITTSNDNNSNNENNSSDTPVGIDDADLLFEVDAADVPADFTTAGSRSAPEKEPTSAAARDALAQRRQLFARSSRLHAVVQDELRAEVARDMKDGVSAVPPLAPAGWHVLHETGSSYFTMSRVLAGGYGDGTNASTTTGITESPSPRYRSVHDMMTGRRPNARPSSSAPAASRVAAAASNGPHADEARRRSSNVRYARSDTHVTVFAPFKTLDLTLFDPSVDICEWTRFDVLVRKSMPSALPLRARASPAFIPLQGQQEVWDEGRCMFLRLACVNSELRIRSVQFVSHRLARALEEHAVFGRGEPLYLEFLRRQRRERAVSRAHGRDRWQTAVSPVHVFDAPSSSPSNESSSSSRLHPTSVPAATAAAGVGGDGAGALTSQFDRGGEFARSFAYGGPYMTELSKELREALHEYVMLQLGVTNEVTEYVCQMQFFLEQEEYVGWLAQWGQLASTLQQTL